MHILDPGQLYWGH